MPGWLRRVFNVLGAVDAATTEPWLFHLLIATINTIRTNFNAVRSAWHNFWFGAHMAWTGMTIFGHEVELSLWQIAYRVIPRLDKAIAHETIRAEASERSISALAWHLYTVERRDRELSILSLLKWALLHLLLPLIQLGSSLAWQIVNRITPLFDLVMNAGRLADWVFWHLISLLEREAMNVARVTTRFFIAMLYHNLNAVLLILEDAIDAIL
jgi:hypothetical protein